MDAHEAVDALVLESRRLKFAAKRNAATMAGLLVGRLRDVDAGTLAELKVEIAKFNRHTGKWARA